ncbi:MAG: Smr/MutS family protein [Candidatus Pacebacteria bacterium]|nr:Smr/MutS family protein [Candidatus Paceibacterota bacterium]
MGSSKKSIRHNPKEPDIEVDFHSLHSGISFAEVESFAHEALNEIRLRGIRRALFIVGKGLHSSHGPVIRPMIISIVEGWKQDGIITSWEYERGVSGTLNEGALVIHLL